MAKRYYSKVEQHRDKFNDETKHDKSPRKMGPYHYDRQSMDGDERSSHRKMSMRDGYYAGSEPRRHQEMRDAGMIHEDHSAVANLPQHVVQSYYPRDNGWLPEDLDDTIRGVDAQKGYDNRKKMEHFFPKKV